MTHHNKYLLYGPDLIFHGHHFPAAHSGTSVLMSCSILLTFGCLPMSWWASSKAPTLLPMPFSGSGPSMHKGTMVRFSRWAVVFPPLCTYKEVFPPLCTYKGILWTRPRNNLARSSPNSWWMWYREPDWQKPPLMMDKLSQSCLFLVWNWIC